MAENKPKPLSPPVTKPQVVTPPTTIPGIPQQQIIDLQNRVTNLEGSSGGNPGTQPDIFANSITIDAATLPCIVLKGSQTSWDIFMDDTANCVIIQAGDGGQFLAIGTNYISMPGLPTADPQIFGQLYVDSNNFVKYSQGTGKHTGKGSSHTK